jgi:hypothetical protein
MGLRKRRSPICIFGICARGANWNVASESRSITCIHDAANGEEGTRVELFLAGVAENAETYVEFASR